MMASCKSNPRIPHTVEVGVNIGASMVEMVKVSYEDVYSLLSDRRGYDMATERTRRI